MSLFVSILVLVSCRGSCLVCFLVSSGDSRVDSRSVSSSHMSIRLSSVALCIHFSLISRVSSSHLVILVSCMAIYIRFSFSLVSCIALCIRSNFNCILPCLALSCLVLSCLVLFSFCFVFVSLCSSYLVILLSLVKSFILYFFFFAFFFRYRRMYHKYPQM